MEERQHAIITSRNLSNWEHHAVDEQICNQQNKNEQM
jgi:hypothetical protein